MIKMIATPVATQVGVASVEKRKPEEKNMFCIT